MQRLNKWPTVWSDNDDSCMFCGPLYAHTKIFSAFYRDVLNRYVHVRTGQCLQSCSVPSKIIITIAYCYYYYHHLEWLAIFGSSFGTEKKQKLSEGKTPGSKEKKAVRVRREDEGTWGSASRLVEQVSLPTPACRSRVCSLLSPPHNLKWRSLFNLLSVSARPRTNDADNGQVEELNGQASKDGGMTVLEAQAASWSRTPPCSSSLSRTHTMYLCFSLTFVLFWIDMGLWLNRCVGAKQLPAELD